MKRRLEECPSCKTEMVFIEEYTRNCFVYYCPECGDFYAIQIYAHNDHFHEIRRRHPEFTELFSKKVLAG